MSDIPQGELTPDQIDFIDFLCVPRDEREISENEWERRHGYHIGTVARWKAKNKTFRAALKERFADINESPDRIQEVIEALFKAGVAKSDTKALVDYLKLVGAYVEKHVQIDERTEVKKMSNSELAAALREELAIIEAQDQLEKL